MFIPSGVAAASADRVIEVDSEFFLLLAGEVGDTVGYRQTSPVGSIAPDPPLFNNRELEGLFQDTSADTLDVRMTLPNEPNNDRTWSTLILSGTFTTGQGTITLLRRDGVYAAEDDGTSRWRFDDITDHMIDGINYTLVMVWHLPGLEPLDLLFEDNFNEVSTILLQDHTPDIGIGWDPTSTNADLFDVIGGESRAESITGGGPNHIYMQDLIPTGPVFIEAEVQLVPAAAGIRGCVVFRANGTDASNSSRYQLMQRGDSHLIVRRIVDGSSQDIIFESTTTPWIAGGINLVRAELYPETDNSLRIVLFHNGEEVFDITETAQLALTEGLIGLYREQGGPQYHSVKVGPIVGAPSRPNEDFDLLCGQVGSDVGYRNESFGFLLPVGFTNDSQFERIVRFHSVGSEQSFTMGLDGTFRPPNDFTFAQITITGEFGTPGSGERTLVYNQVEADDYDPTDDSFQTSRWRWNVPLSDFLLVGSAYTVNIEWETAPTFP